MGKLERAKKELRFISHALGSEYLDAETLDELSRASFNALQLLDEHEQETLQLPHIEEASTMVIYEPIGGIRSDSFGVRVETLVDRS